MKFLRRIIGLVDRTLFYGILKRIYEKEIFERSLNNHNPNLFKHGFSGQYIKNNNSSLNVLSDKYGSDKGEVNSEENPYPWQSHSYSDIYELLFRLRRTDIEIVIECGLGTNNPDLKSSMGINGKPGASLRVWRDFFPNAQIIGIDIDANILFEEERIKTFECDQTSSKSIDNFCKSASLAPSSVDIIIDDGLHEFHAGKSLFQTINKYLAVDGIYVIEDVIPSDYIQYKDYFSELESKFTVHFLSLHRPDTNVEANRLIIIRHNDQLKI